MSLKFNTIDDFQFNNKTVLVRVDINSPVDPNTGIILDDTRMKLHAETISELSDKGAKTVILAHQSRPGKKDFTTLEQHAHVLSKILGRPVIYVEDIFGCAARETIARLKARRYPSPGKCSFLLRRSFKTRSSPTSRNPYGEKTFISC